MPPLKEHAKFELFYYHKNTLKQSVFLVGEISIKLYWIEKVLILRRY